MMLVACLLSLVAATALPSNAPPQGPTHRYPSEEALRRYAQGRLLEERGRRDLAIGEYSRAFLLDDSAGTLARRMSEASAMTGEVSRSLEFAERALAIDPNDARAQWLKGTALLHLGRGEDALIALQAAAALDSERVEYARTLARAADSEGRLDLAVRNYRRVVFLEPEDVESWFQLAAGEARLGHYGAADTALAEVLDQNPMRPGAFLLQALIHENLGRLDEAMENYRRHLAAHPSDLATRRRALNLLAREKRWDEALREARQLVALRPEDREYGEIEADLAFSAGKTGDAEKVFKRMRKQWPDDPDVMSAIVSLQARHGRGNQAVEEAERWLAKKPDDPMRLMVAARARTLNKQPDQALAHLQRAVSVAPDSLAPRAMLARFYEHQKRGADAERVWTEAAKRFPGHNGVAFDLAACRERLGDIDGAEAAVRDVLRREPDNPTALNFLGYLWADHNKNLEEAVDMIARAIAQAPDNGAFVDSLGWAYYRLGRLNEARVQLERAARLTQGDAIVLEHLGDVYNALQMKELAKEQYRLSLAGDPQNARVKAKLDGLR
jgi:tetratricopeptide (TPR) repeat protein